MTHTFHTNINCGNCIAKVTPFMDEAENITHWEVDTQDPNKVLTVESSLSESEIIALIASAGYTATPKPTGLFSKWLKR